MKLFTFLCITISLSTLSFASAHAQTISVDCSSPSTVFDVRHCKAKTFFEKAGLPLPQCAKHPKTYGEPGWRNKKGDLISVTNKHHEQKQFYCKVYKPNTGVSGQITSTPETHRTVPEFIADPQDIGAMPHCTGITQPVELRICKVQQRAWKILDRQIKWQQRQEERQNLRDDRLTRLEKTINALVKSLTDTQRGVRLDRSQVKPKVVGAPRSTTSRGVRVGAPVQRTTARRKCSTVPLRERSACMEAFTK